jgi:hypothetical protein
MTDSGTRFEVVAGLIVLLAGLGTALGSAVVRAFDVDSLHEQSFVYTPGLIIAAVGGLAMLYAVRTSRGLLWATTITGIVYSALIVFGAGPLPLMATTLLQIAVVSSTLRGQKKSPIPQR